MTDNVSQGIVLRIYDGHTLFEQATDDLEKDALTKFAQDFADRVSENTYPEGQASRPYRPATWAQRLESSLEAGDHDSDSEKRKCDDGSSFRNSV